MATAKQATAPRPKRRKSQKSWAPFWSHEYTVRKLSPTLTEVEVSIVQGSRAAIELQRKIEDDFYFAVVINNTTGEEEYRTPGCEK